MFHSLQIKGKFTPLQDWLIVAPEKIPERTSGGVLLPQNARDFGRCPVIAAGPRCELKPGAVLWIERFVEGEFKFTLNGQSVYAIRERHANVVLADSVDKPKRRGKK